MPKKSSTSRPVPWGFKILAGLQLVIILFEIGSLFLAIPEVKYFGYTMTGVAIPTLLVLNIVIDTAILYAYFNRNKWGFFLIMFTNILSALNTLFTLIQESASKQHLELFTSILGLLLHLLIIKYIYDRRWYFNR